MLFDKTTPDLTFLVSDFKLAILMMGSKKMKKIAFALSSLALLTFITPVFATVRLTSHPAKLPSTGDFQGKIYDVTVNNQAKNAWVRLIVGRQQDQRYVLEFNDDDMAVANTLLDAKGKHINALYAYANGTYTVTFFELS